MSRLNEVLAALRKKNNLTQEELGARLGVSAQSISKWENSISMPDICLLPILAETLGVSIDELFGISNQSVVEHTDAFPKRIHEEVFINIASWFDDVTSKDAYNEYMDEKYDNTASVIFTKNGAVFENKNIGIVFPRTQQEAIKLLLDEDAREFISLFSNNAVLATVYHLACSKQFATVASISNKIGLSEEEVRSALQKIEKYNIINRQTINLDDEMIEVYRIQRTHALLFVYAIMQLAKQAAIPEDKYFYYYGNDCWCY